MSQEHDEHRIDVQLTNEYGAPIPLWTDEGQTDGHELGISEGLRSDLAAFADRWESSVPADVYDDRFIDVPVLPSLIDAWRSLRRLAHPAERRATKAEDAALRSLGEELRDRVQRELGSRYRVTYVHW